MAAHLKKTLIALREAFIKAQKVGAPVLRTNDPVKGSFLDFRSQQKQGLANEINGLFNELEKIAENSEPWVRNQFVKLINDKSVETVDDFLELLGELKSKSSVDFNSSVVPADIREDIEADVEELNKCFESDCYRSAVMLCGRILETALHRKYFEVTGNDLLEKAPGIGLGNLIAKLSEKDIAVDPGLGNQIHIINQIRIFSVHKKQDPFYPSKQQTNAIMLYTMDAIEKLFKKQ